MYLVYGAPRTRTMRVLWALEELGQPYEHAPIAPRSAEALALTPSGKIPLMRVDDAVLTDSVAIVTFLADRHGGLTHPAGTLARARQDGFTQFCVDEIEGALWTAAKHAFALPEAERVPAVRDTARAEYARALETLAARLGPGPFLTGETFTVADLLIGHCAGWAEAANFPAPSPGPLADYVARTRARPAFARAMARAAAATRA